MTFCIHRYSIVKRWMEDGKLMLLQRCRKCDTWIKREIDFTATKPTISKERLERIDKDHSELEPWGYGSVATGLDKPVRNAEYPMVDDDQASETGPSKL